MRISREHIVEVAAAAIHRQGYANTSLADLAAELGIFKGNISYYFKSKTDLLAAVQAYWRQTYVERIVADRPWPDTGAALEHFFGVVAGSAPLLAAHGCPVGALAGECARIAPGGALAASDQLGKIAAWLTAQLAREHAPDRAAELAEHILAVMQGAALLAQTSGDAAVIGRQIGLTRNWLDALSKSA